MRRVRFRLDRVVSKNDTVCSCLRHFTSFHFTSFQGGVVQFDWFDYMQWPETVGSRRRAAEYVVHDLKVDPLSELLPVLTGGKSVSVLLENQMIVLGKGDRITFPWALCQDPELQCEPVLPTQVGEAQLVRFALHCICLRISLPVAACFVRAQQMLRPGSALCLGLWDALAYLHVAPAPVALALRCARPDLSHIVRRLYGEWLRLCRSPKAVSAALAFLTGVPWCFQSGTSALARLTDFVRDAQVAARPVQPFSLMLCDLVVDERGGVVVSGRDKALAAIVFCVGPHAREFSEGVSAFRDVRDEVPLAFRELSHGGSPIDEIEAQPGD